MMNSYAAHDFRRAAPGTETTGPAQPAPSNLLNPPTETEIAALLSQLSGPARDVLRRLVFQRDRLLDGRVLPAVAADPIRIDNE